MRVEEVPVTRPDVARRRHARAAAQDQHRALKVIEQFTELCEGLPFLSEIEIEKIETLLKTPDLHDIMRYMKSMKREEKLPS